MARRGVPARPAPVWSRRRMLGLLVGAALTVVVVAAGLALAVVDAVRPARPGAVPAGPVTAVRVPQAAGGSGAGGGADARDVLAAAPMPAVSADAAHPGPVSLRDSGPPIVLPAATRMGPAGVPTGFGRTAPGALAQLAAVDQAALQSGSLPGARSVIAAWALPGGPTTSGWSGVRAVAALLNAAGLSGGGSGRLAVVVTALMSRVKGTVGPDFVVACVDFEIDVTLARTARGAAADCQRMVWHGDRWMVGPGREPARAPSVWPDTDTAIGVGWRDLRRG